MQRLERITNHLRSPQLPGYLPGAAKPGALILSREVADALRKGEPVIALESTIISHGMPFPQNLETALAVEAEARKHGAVPATIAILQGQIHVGLEPSQLRTLAELGSKARKCSRRDLALAIADKANAATTVAATMYIAHMAGISVFVTGGIGGVHRGVEETMDISADLTEMSKTPVAVVCAGIKSILDIGKTLEFLETQGVTVASLGTRRFPAFFTADSGFESPCTVDSEQHAARVIAANLQLGLGSGIVIAVPVPADEAATAAKVEDATKQALAEAKDQKVSGRDVTPFLLKRVNELTKGDSLRANIALIKNNTRKGAAIAASLATLQAARKHGA